MNNDGQKSFFHKVRMVAGMAGVNARAYAAVIGTVFRERLWRVPARGAPVGRVDGRTR